MLKKGFETFIKELHRHSTTSYQGSGSTGNIPKVVETELRHGTNNPISYYGLVTREPDREMRA